MSGRASRRKGKAGELEVAREFQKHGFDVRRTPNSGGLSLKGDLLGLDGYSVEIKRCETLLIPKWLRQTHADAAGARTPLLIFRTSALKQADPLGRWHLTEPLDSWLADQQELRELRSILAVARRQGEAFAEFELADALEAYDAKAAA